MAHAREKVRYAVVGGGPFTRDRVLPAFEHTQNSELAAIISDNEPRRNLLARRHGVSAGGLEAFEALLEQSHARAVYIAAPCAQHRSLTERAARSGMHVLCDTPMADTIEDCRAMIASCRAAQVKLMLAYRLHFDAASLDARAVVRDGKLGAPRLFSSVLTRQPERRGDRTRAMPPGAVWQLALHPINTARQLFGDEPIAVFCSAAGSDQQFAHVDPSLSATLIFDDDRYAQFTVSLAASAFSSYRLIGERGHLLLEPAYGCDESHEYVLTLGANRVERQFPPGHQLAAELTSFSRAIAEDGDVEPGGAEGLADVRVLEALRDSRTSGRVEKLAKGRSGGI